MNPFSVTGALLACKTRDNSCERTAKVERRTLATAVCVRIGCLSER